MVSKVWKQSTEIRNNQKNMIGPMNLNMNMIFSNSAPADPCLMLMFTHSARDAKEIDVMIRTAKGLSMLSILNSSILVRPILEGLIWGSLSDLWLKSVLY